MKALRFERSLARFAAARVAGTLAPVSPRLSPIATSDTSSVPSKLVGRYATVAVPRPKFIVNGSLLKKAASVSTRLDRMRPERNVVVPRTVILAGR